MRVRAGRQLRTAESRAVGRSGGEHAGGCRANCAGEREGICGEAHHAERDGEDELDAVELLPRGELAEREHLEHRLPGKQARSRPRSTNGQEEEQAHDARGGASKGLAYRKGALA